MIECHAVTSYAPAPLHLHPLHQHVGHHWHAAHHHVHHVHHWHRVVQWVCHSVPGWVQGAALAGGAAALGAGGYLGAQGVAATLLPPAPPAVVGPTYQGEIFQPYVTPPGPNAGATQPPGPSPLPTYPPTPVTTPGPSAVPPLAWVPAPPTTPPVPVPEPGSAVLWLLPLGAVAALKWRKRTGASCAGTN